MHNFAIEFVKLLGGASDFMFGPMDSLIEKLSFASWAKDALIDSLHMVPFLLFVFFVIEFVEYFFSHKMSFLLKLSNKAGPVVGSLLASFPQCGFSVVASTLYTKRLITAGTLIAVYLSTSDEAIPVMLAVPGSAPMVIHLLVVKLFIGIFAGYLINFLLVKESIKAPEAEQVDECSEIDVVEDANKGDEGCCNHHLDIPPDKKELFLHPIIHTLSVFFFVFLVTLGINYFVTLVGGEENLGKYFLNDSVFQPVIMAFLGLIPNCAASVAITMMYLKGAIGFGSVVAGLCSSAGLGMLVLIRKNADFKDTLRIIGLLLSVSIASGIIIQFFYN